MGEKLRFEAIMKYNTKAEMGSRSATGDFDHVMKELHEHYVEIQAKGEIRYIQIELFPLFQL